MSHLYAASSNDWKGRRYHGFGLNIQFPTLWENGLHNREWKCVLIQNLLPPTPLSYPSFPPRAIQFNSSWFYSAKLVLHATSYGLHSLSYELFILASLLSPQRVTFLSQAFFLLFTFCIFLPIFFFSADLSLHFLPFPQLSYFTIMPGFHGNATYESNSWGAVFQLQTARFAHCCMRHPLE